MGRRFRHLDHDWDVELTGASHGVGFGFPPSITSWGVWFKRVDEPDAEAFYGSISKSDPADLSEDQLQRSLERALVLKALEDPNWDWRTTQGVAQSTGVSEDRVRQIVESSPGVVIRSQVPDEHGRALYASRRHYKRRRSFLDSLRTT